MRAEVDKRAFADALRAVGTGKVELRSGGTSPLVVGAVGAPRFAVVVPLRI